MLGAYFEKLIETRTYTRRILKIWVYPKIYLTTSYKEHKEGDIRSILSQLEHSHLLVQEVHFPHEISNFGFPVENSQHMAS